jgi:hypothetical protein
MWDPETWRVIKAVAAEPTFEETGDGEFPCDYQDTYDLGVKNGRIEFARELLKNRVLVIPEENFLRFDEEDEGC